MQFDTGVVWFRRDLRTNDNTALWSALTSCKKVHCVFVFDRDILDGLPRQDRRLEFIRESLVGLDEDLRTLSNKPGAGIIVRQGVGYQEVVRLASELNAQVVFAARDYEPQAIARDTKAREALADHGISFQTVKDHVIFEGREILTKAGTPYGVFTPYKNAWLARLDDACLEA
ncbi:MAG: deoxyribodipyrimidine photo-lyase, partial [Rhodoferax sp.]|nr:deoxyribodipyrimidine photo-lyase [Rhodoferax sp.]